MALSVNPLQNLVTGVRHMKDLAVNWEMKQAVSLATAVLPAGFWVLLETPAENPTDHLH